MMFHGYESGFYNFGRQTLLQPVEWTTDGWFKIPDNINTDRPNKKHSLKGSPSTYTLSDNFSGTVLKPHWKFFGEFDVNRFNLANHSLTIKAKGNSASNCSPLLCIPSDHSYMVDIEMIIEGKATGALLLFYNNSHHSGILADNNNILANINGWQFVTEHSVHNSHVFLRLKNLNNTVDMYYSTDGSEWTKIENSLEVSSMHHNVLGGFLSLRIGLCSIGEGSVTFRNFTYEPVK
jgi:beta-xylosidase